MNITLTGQVNYIEHIATEIYILKKNNAHIILLSRDPGAGKTTLTQMIGKLLGVTKHITSPTYSLLHEYNIPNHTLYDELIHIDAYRLETYTYDDLGIIDYLNRPQSLVIIEWHEHLENILKSYASHAIHIAISQKNNDERIYTIQQY